MPPKQETFYTITAARASDLEHFFAGSIAVGAGEQSRSRRREPGAETGGRRNVKNGWQMSGCGDVRSARGRGGDSEHLSAGSIAVGAGEQSRSRQRECGGGCGGVGKERAGVGVGGEQSVKNGRQMSRRGDMRGARGRGCGGMQGNESSWQMSKRGDMRRGAAAARNGNFRGRERVRF